MQWHSRGAAGRSPCAKVPISKGACTGIYLGIEVKHFRWKEKHDPIEDGLLASGADDLVLHRIPHLSETEGQEDAWDQMSRFAKEKSYQCAPGEFNVIFFWSSTQAHWDATLLTAAHIYEDAIAEPSSDPKLRDLSAMMMMGVWGSVGSDRRSISWNPIWNSNRPPTPELTALLDEIRDP